MRPIGDNAYVRVPVTVEERAALNKIAERQCMRLPMLLRPLVDRFLAEPQPPKRSSKK